MSISTALAECMDPALNELQEDSYDTKGLHRDKGIKILRIMNGGAIDPRSGENFDETGRPWDLDHFYPKSKALSQKTQFEDLWARAFAHLPEDKRPAPDPNSAINLRFCERHENILKADTVPTEEELIDFWQGNYENILRHEIEIIAALDLEKFDPYIYGIMDDLAIDHFDAHEAQAYHIHRVYEAIGIAITQAEQTGIPFQEIDGFYLADHTTMIKSHPAYPAGDELREGKIIPMRLNENGEAVHFSDLIDKFNAGGYQRSSGGFAGSVVHVDDDLKRWYQRYSEFARAEIPTLLSSTLSDMRALMANSKTVGQRLAEIESTII